MLVVSSREFRDQQKKYLELSEKKRVIIKRKQDFIELIHRGHSIPESASPINSTERLNELKARIMKLEKEISEGKMKTNTK